MQYCEGIDYTDLIQEGWIALIDVAKRFDVERGLKFSTFAYFRVEGQIKDAIRKEIKNNRAEAQYEQKLFENAVGKLARTLERFEALDEQEREILRLYAEGHTQNEIAEQVDLDQSNISRNLQKIKELNA